MLLLAIWLCAHHCLCMCLQNTPKPARKAPPPPSNHVVVNEDVEQISGESSSNASEEVPISPEPKARSSSDSKVEVSESRKSRSSRSRSSSVEIDENVHRDLEQQRDQPLSNEQGTSQGNPKLRVYHPVMPDRELTYGKTNFCTHSLHIQKIHPSTALGLAQTAHNH